MKEDKILMNFQMPASMKARFDAISEMKGLSKTSILNSLVESYILDQVKNEEHKVNTLQAIDLEIQKRKFIRFKDFIERG